MNENEKIRIASARGYGIKNRCRKEERIFIQANGLNDEDAILNLKRKIQSEKLLYRKFNIVSEISLYDGLKINRGDCSIIQQPIYPSKDDNLKVVTI